jgi:hypothetical protein
MIKSLVRCNEQSFSMDDRCSRAFCSDIRGGSVYRSAKAAIRLKAPNAKIVGLILAVDDTMLTQHSGSHNGRPLYMTCTNLPLSVRRKSTTLPGDRLDFCPIYAVLSPKTKIQRRRNGQAMRRQSLLVLSWKDA